MTRKHLFFILKLAVSGGLIWFVLKDVDMTDLVAQVGAMDLGWLAAAATIAFVLVGIGGVRWRLVLGAIEAPLSLLQAVRLFYLGVFFNQTLPSSVGGDPVRMYFAYRQGLPVRKAVAGVFLERLITLTGLILVVDLMAPGFLDRLDPGHPIQGWLPVALLIINLVAVGGFVFLLSLNLLPERFRTFKVIHAFHALGAETRALFSRPLNALGALVFGCINHALLAVAAYALARGLEVDVALLDCLVVVPLVMLATTIPISIAGWGVRESAMVFGLGVVGVAGADAVLVSLVLGLVILFVALPGGLIWFRIGEKVDTDVLERA